MSIRKRDCLTCDATLSHSTSDPVSELCPQALEQKRARARERRRDRREHKGYAAQLREGIHIAAGNNHHKGMAYLKAESGDPRPQGMTLSLVNYGSPDSYWGYYYYRGERKPHRLSTNPADYCWEPMGDNNRRDAARRAAGGDE